MYILNIDGDTFNFDTEADALDYADQFLLYYMSPFGSKQLLPHLRSVPIEFNDKNNKHHKISLVRAQWRRKPKFTPEVEQPLREEVWKVLPVRDLLNWCATNRSLHEICDKPSTWSFLLKRDYNLDYSQPDARLIYQDIPPGYQPLFSDYSQFLVEYGPLIQKLRTKYTVKTVPKYPSHLEFSFIKSGINFQVEIGDIYHEQSNPDFDGDEYEDEYEDQQEPWPGMILTFQDPSGPGMVELAIPYPGGKNMTSFFIRLINKIRRTPFDTKNINKFYDEIMK